MTENNAEILYYNNVCSSVSSIDAHIAKHALGIDRLEYLRIANMALTLDNPKSELLDIVYSDKKYRTVLRGEIEYEGSKYRIVRTLFCIADLSEDVPYPGYAVKIRIVGKGQPSYHKPDLPAWTEPSILDAIEKLGQENTFQGSYKYETPVQHFVRIRRKA